MKNLIKNHSAQTQKTAVVILCVFFFMAASCVNKNADYKNDKDYILGKWKLVKYEYRLMTSPPSPRQSFDYSKNNIVYEFKRKNILTVTGETDNVEYRGLEMGDHAYEMNYNLKDYMTHGLPFPYLIKIGTIGHSYLLSAKELKINHIGEVDAYAYY